jgi:hypothetical protein
MVRATVKVFTMIDPGLNSVHGYTERGSAAQGMQGAHYRWRCKIIQIHHNINGCTLYEPISKKKVFYVSKTTIRHIVNK